MSRMTESVRLAVWMANMEITVIRIVTNIVIMVDVHRTMDAVTRAVKTDSMAVNALTDVMLTARMRYVYSTMVDV